MSPIGQRTRERTGGRATSAISIGVGIVVGALILLLDALHAFSGVLALACALIVLVGLPTARALSRRVALNGAIGLGLIPLLWWFPWPGTLFSHSGIILAALVGVVAGMAAGRAPRRRLVPTVALTDLLPLATAIFCGWFFAPFVTYSSGPSSVSMLRNAFGNDDVAHFNMFEMIRRYSVAGPLWPQHSGGRAYAYETYPQHFHILTAFAAELWSGAHVNSVSQEVGLFGIGSALVISTALVTLVAAVVSIGVLRHRPLLALLATTAVVSFLLIGEGGSALTYGFPGYLLAVICAALAVVLVLTPGRPSARELLAVGGAVLVVAHSWSLLAPIAGAAFAVLVLRIRPRLRRSGRRSVIPQLVAVVLTLAGVLWAVLLVEAASGAAGSAQDALSTNGASPVTILKFTAAFALLVLVFSIGPVIWRRRFGSLRSFAGASITAAVACIAGLVTGAGLVVLQLAKSPHLSYFQFKYLNGLTLVLAVVAVVGVAILLAILSLRILSRVVTNVVAVVAALCVLAFAFVPLATDPLEPAGGIGTEGLEFRHNLEVQAHATPAPATDLLSAAALMATAPCVRPIYLAPGRDIGQSNQWATSLSASWNLSTGPINKYLFEHPAATTAALVPVLRHLLDSQADRCAIVSPGEYQALGSTLQSEFGSRLLTWSHES